MQLYINEIVAPYFDGQKKALGLPASQKSMVKLDVWSVHRSKEFRTWMKNEHPTIILDYVPGGCTGLFQPCDVGIQRLFKHSLKRSYHEDIVEEILGKIDSGQEKIIIEKKLEVLRDRSVKWLVDAYNTINNEQIVKKVRLRTHLTTFVHTGSRLSRCAVLGSSTYRMRALLVSTLARPCEISRQQTLSFGRS
jgi:hypothetical protein